jgi:integrase
VRDGRLARNPADKVRLPRASRPEKRFLTQAELADLSDAAGDSGLVVRVLANCGLRFGELAALRVGRVDPLRRRLLIAESVTEVGGKAVFGTPKNHATRSPAVPRTIADELALHVADRGPDEFVSPAPNGGVLRLMNFRRR